MRLACAALVGCTLLAGLPGRAAAETEVERKSPRHVVSLPLLSLAGAAGIGVQLEQKLAAPRWSVAVALAARGNAGGDYSSLATTVSAEARYWLRGRAIWSDLPAGSAVGWFAGARLDVTRVRTRDTIDDRALGASLGFAETLTLGYRFAVKGRVAITPSIGLGVKSEVDTSGRLPSWTRGDARIGLTLGWLF